MSLITTSKLQTILMGTVRPLIEDVEGLNIFSGVQVGGNVYAAEGNEDILPLVAGSNINIEATQNGIQFSADADTQIQSDWNQTNSSSKDFIKNKPTIPSAYTSNPAMDGTASAGSSTAWARGDHVHPKDTTKVDVLQTANIAYGTCSTDADTAQKVVTLSTKTGWKLEAGAIIVVKFTNTNTANNPTLKVGSTDAKSIWYNTAVITTSNLNKAGYANRYEKYMYDGTNYVWIGHSTDDNTTYTPPKLGIGYGTCSTSSGTEYAASMTDYTLVTGGIVTIKFSNAVPASATLNINSKGAKSIYHKGSAIAANVIKAGDYATFIYSTQYHLIAIDRTATEDNDTKNTAGSTDSSSKLFLVGATSQAANPQTYSHDTAYVGTDGCLYSGSKKVLTDIATAAQIRTAINAVR